MAHMVTLPENQNEGFGSTQDRSNQDIKLPPHRKQRHGSVTSKLPSALSDAVGLCDRLAEEKDGASGSNKIGVWIQATL